MACINPNSPEFKAALERTGGNPLLAEIELDEQNISYGLKSVNALQSDKAIQLFNTLQKNRVTGDAFWNKIQQDLQIPKDQIELLKQYNTTDREQLITNMLADYSFAIEINLGRSTTERQTRYFEDENQWLEEEVTVPYDRAILQPDGRYKIILVDSNGEEFSPGTFTKKEAIENFGEYIFNNVPPPSSYYSNLTVPGGTNYTENEIATPAITPNIKGHAQFATDKGIGWFRSDDKVYLKKEETKELPNFDFIETFNTSKGVVSKEWGTWYLGNNSITNQEAFELYKEVNPTTTIVDNTESKTRRILEVQSDLFQKGRDKKGLVNVGEISYQQQKEWRKEGLTAEQMNDRQNQMPANKFLQLLNKDNNWVTFFVKSIIQDSAKKGYEKVLFPTGNTASKVEGHTTLEEFKKQKEDRIAELENDKELLNNILKKENYRDDGNSFVDNRTVKIPLKYNTISGGKTFEETKQATLNKVDNEINQLKQELERVEKEGFDALKPIFKFYEENVSNVLKKQGYAPKQVTDEYGNTWNEVTILSKRDSSDILLQKEGTEVGTASPKTVAMIKDFLKRVGVDIQVLQKVVINGKPIGANGAAFLMQKLVQVAEGKEAQALPEEAMHFAVAIIKQTDPALYKKLLSEINSYRILKDVFATYSSDPNYQTKDGKPDVVKLKEEAIGKLLTQIILQKGDAMMETAENVSKAQTWWQRIIQAIKNLIPKSGFDRLAMDIVSGKNIGTAKDIREEQDAVMLQKDPQAAVIDKLKEISSKISKKDEKYQIDGKTINRRVTDLIKDWYTRRFNNKDLIKSEFQTAVDDLKREKGTAGHADFEKAFEVFVDEDGLLRDTPLDDSTYVSKINPNNRDMYELLKENMRIRLNSFPKGTRFLKEITVYDPNRSLAGTIDFLAITPEGKVSILDWKFMNLNIEKYEMEGKIPDVPWYKVSAWRQQMEQYKLILQNVYGVDPQNFEQTRMIPIQATYSKGDAKANILPELLSIKIGDVDVKNIKEDYLIPVGLEEEKTGDKEIDELIEKLNAVYKLLSEKKATPDQKREKAEQLNSLFYAIRQLQMKQNVKPLIDQATILNKEIQKTIQMYDAKFKGKDPNIFFEKEIDEFAEELQSAQDAIKIYTELDTMLSSFFLKEDASGELNEIEESLEKASRHARKLSAALNNILNEYTSEIIAKRERIKSLLSPEKVVRGITKFFASTSTIQLNAMHVLYRKANKAFTYAGYDTNTENNRLIGLKSAYDKWASSKGLNKKNYFSYIKKKDKNELIDEFNPEFYSQLKRKIDERDTEWIIENIDVREYNEELKKQLEKEFEYIENKSRAGTEDQIEATIRLEKAKARQLYDTSTLESPGWLLYDYVKKFPKRDKWESTEWKQLNKPENKPALDFYNYIKERNAEYRELGYINRADARVFLPYVEKGLVEKLIVGGNVKLGEQFFRGISIDNRDTGYGRINPLDGKPVDVIPKYFTEEIEGEVSDDLFRTMALYNEAAIRYKYVSEIENQVRALVRVERNKKAIATSRFGKTVYKDGVLQYNPNNDENSQLVEDMMKAIIYGQKYLESETFDQLLGKIGNWGGKINEKLGMKVFPENLTDRQVSVNKIIDNLNNSFQISTLGLNVLSATSNFFGGTAQSVINAGKYFTKTDFIKAETMLFVDKLNVLGTREEKKKLLAALEYFLPLTENYNREIANKLSISKLNEQNIQDFLMVLMRKGDLAVQTANFYAFLNNTIVENGQVVNVREHLRNQPKYKDRYAKSADVRDRLNEEFENDVKKLMDEKGVLKTAQLVDNKLVIPGVERKSESVVQLRRDVQQMSKDALGNLTEDDLRKINMNIYGKSFMVFKNWIPRQIDVRMGNIKYNSARDAYEWGRMRSVFNVIAQDWFRSAANLRNSLIANEKGVEFLRELFEKKKIDYKNDTGKELDMTEDEFMDLVRQNIRNQMYDLILLTTIFLLVAALKANMPDDEEDPAVKAQYRFVVKMADKFKDELMYFYDPTSFQNLISKGIFPSVSLIENARKAMGNFFIENWAIATGDEKTVEDTKVIKYWMKTFPVTNQIAGYLPMFFPELAKDLGLKVQSNYGIR